MIDICGRKVKIQTGTKSQTVNICSSAGVNGLYDFIVRLTPPFVSAEALLSRNFISIQELVRYLERDHLGRIERMPAIRPSVATEVRMDEVTVVPDRIRTIPSSKFRVWRDEWDKLGAQQRIGDIVEFWQAPIPGPWMRSEADIPRRLLEEGRYTRGNLNDTRRGEHVIEYEILVGQFDRVTCFGRPLLDGVNAFPLVRDSAGGRNDDVEADLVLLAGPPISASLFVADVKKTDGNPWLALVQNLRQLRLFKANLACSSIFSLRGMNVNVDQVCGGVIAPKTFYSNSGKRRKSLQLARKLSESMQQEHKIMAELIVWDPYLGQLYPYV
jgi:hypothetical protein